MRVAQSIFAGSVAVLAALASPAFAKSSSLNSHANANAQKIDEEPASQTCHAYQQAPDGLWVPLACHEGSENAPVSRGKSASRAPGEGTR